MHMNYPVHAYTLVLLCACLDSPYICYIYCFDLAWIIKPIPRNSGPPVVPFINYTVIIIMGNRIFFQSMRANRGFHIQPLQFKDGKINEYWQIAFRTIMTISSKDPIESFNLQQTEVIEFLSFTESSESQREKANTNYLESDAFICASWCYFR